MAANLVAAGYDVIVHDAEPERERGFVTAHGGRGCGGDRAALAEASILVTMLPNGQVIRDVLLGEDGIAGRPCPPPGSPPRWMRWSRTSASASTCEALAEFDDERADLSRSLEGWEVRGGVRMPPPRRPTPAG
jgi:3-hydroxyisobutyrate dehydrogenase-like beta-hydroxyacid dehydrogenase